LVEREGWLIHTSVLRNDKKTFTQYILANQLVFLFNKIFKSGYPGGWSTVALTPVPKPKGNPAVMDDYRGIAVGSALSKLYSMVLLNRQLP